MKTGISLVCLIAVVLMTAGCYTAPPPVAVQTSPPPAPPPPPTGYVMYAPDYYVWDGYNYIGVSGSTYVYWSGGAWLLAPPVIINRFHGWTRYHPGWRRGAIRYRRDRFR